MTEESQPPSYRWGVVFALTWRVVTELMRRHDRKQAFKLLHVHPGLSPTGMLYVRKGIDIEAGGSGSIELHLGGGAFGRAVVKTPFKHLSSTDGARDVAVNYVHEMLTSEDPKAVVDQIERAAGLESGSGIGPTSARVLTYQVLTGILERRAFDRVQYRASSGWYDTSALGCMVAEWARDVPWLVETARLPMEQWVEIAGKATELWAVHPMLPDRGPCSGRLPRSSIIFDAQRGLAWKPGAESKPVDLMRKYNIAKRQIASVIHQVEALLAD